MKKKVSAVGDIARDAANTLLLVAVFLSVISLVFLALFVAMTLTSKLTSKPKPPSVSQQLPPLPVTIAKPREGEVVSGLVPVTLINPNGRNFQKLEFLVDRQLEKKFDAAGADLSDKLYEVNYRLDTTKFTDGEHILSVIAQGMEGKYQTFAVKVNFANRTALKSQ